MLAVNLIKIYPTNRIQPEGIHVSVGCGPCVFWHRGWIKGEAPVAENPSSDMTVARQALMRTRSRE